MSEAAICFKSEADISDCGQFRWSLERAAGACASACW